MFLSPAGRVQNARFVHRASPTNVAAFSSVAASLPIEAWTFPPEAGARDLFQRRVSGSSRFFGGNHREIARLSRRTCTQAPASFHIPQQNRAGASREAQFGGYGSNAGDVAFGWSLPYMKQGLFGEILLPCSSAA